MSDEAAVKALEPPLVFVGRLEEPDIRCIYWYQLRLLWRTILGYVVAFAFVLLALMWFLSEPLKSVCIATGIAISLLATIGPICDRWFVLWRYRKHKEDYLETTVTLTADRVKIENHEFRCEYNWKIIGVVAETREGFMFCSKKLVTYFWLPERVLPAETRNKVSRLLLTNVVRVYRF